MRPFSLPVKNHVSQRDLGYQANKSTPCTHTHTNIERQWERGGEGQRQSLRYISGRMRDTFYRNLSFLRNLKSSFQGFCFSAFNVWILLYRISFCANAWWDICVFIVSVSVCLRVCVVTLAIQWIACPLLFASLYCKKRIMIFYWKRKCHRLSPLSFSISLCILRGELNMFDIQILIWGFHLFALKIADELPGWYFALSTSVLSTGKNGIRS